MTDQTTSPPQSTDPVLDGAFDMLRKLDGLGEAAYLQNGPTLIAEITARAAVAEATTNRIRLLIDILQLSVPRSVVEPMQEERDRLIERVTTHAEA